MTKKTELFNVGLRIEITGIIYETVEKTTTWTCEYHIEHSNNVRILRLASGDMDIQLLWTIRFLKNSTIERLCGFEINEE